MSSRKLKLVLCFCLISVLVLSSIGSVYAYTTELVISPIKQDKTNWCWAASADMAASWIYNGTDDRDQYAIVQHVKGIPVINPYPNVGGSLEDSKNGSEYICHDDSYYVFKYSGTPFTITQIRTAITNSYPLQACVGYYSNNTRNGGHMLVICGADYTDSRIQYIDPWDATSHWVTFSSFQYGLLATGSKYDGTVFLDGPDTTQIAYSGGSLVNTGGNLASKGIVSLKADNGSKEDNTIGIVTVDKLNEKELNTDPFDIESLNNSQDKADVENVCTASTDKIYRYTNKEANNVRLNDAIKIYYLDTIDPVASYKNGASFGSLISYNYEWRVPVADVNNNINYEASIRNTSSEEGWNLSAVGEVDKSSNISYQYNKNEIKKVLKSQGYEKIKDLKFVYTGRYHINLLFFTQDGIEYGIPLNTRTDLLDLSNGAVYKMDDIINVLDKAFNDIKED